MRGKHKEADFAPTKLFWIVNCEKKTRTCISGTGDFWLCSRDINIALVFWLIDYSMERPASPLPCLVVTYEELLARRRQRSNPGSTNTDKRKVTEELTGSAVSSGRDGFDKRDSSSSRARHGVLQITPTHMERHAKRSRDKSKESRARTEDRVLLSDTSGGILREWSTKEGVLENLISRWTGSPAKIARIFSTWWVFAILRHCSVTCMLIRI